MCTSGANFIYQWNSAKFNIPRYHARKSLALQLATDRFLCNISYLRSTFLPQFYIKYHRLKPSSRNHRPEPRSRWHFCNFSVCILSSLQYHHHIIKLKLSAASLSCLRQFCPQLLCLLRQYKNVKNKIETLVNVFRWKPISDQCRKCTKNSRKKCIFFKAWNPKPSPQPHW